MGFQSRLLLFEEAFVRHGLKPLAVVGEAVYSSICFYGTAVEVRACFDSVLRVFFPSHGRDFLPRV